MIQKLTRQGVRDLNSMSDSRNVIDQYKGWAEDLIKEDLNRKSFPFAVLMEQLNGDFNFGTVIRNANAFGAREVFYLGKKNFDRRGAVGTYHYTNVNYLKTHEEFLLLKERYIFIGIDNVPGSVSIENYQWPQNALLLFGEEGNGLTQDTIVHCKDVVAINMYGSVRSLNAGTASGIAMYDFVNKFSRNHNG